LRNYEKIVTNPKDKLLDIESCGQDYFDNNPMGKEEMEIREMLKKYQQQ